MGRLLKLKSASNRIVRPEFQFGSLTMGAVFPETSNTWANFSSVMGAAAGVASDYISSGSSSNECTVRFSSRMKPAVVSARGLIYLRVPVRRPPACVQRISTPAVCRKVMKRLLLVEDDRSLGATLHERLLREKYEVAWVETKQSALGKLNEGLWDLVILDIGLPDGSGFELARHIKSNATMPIMFMTALSTAEHRLEGFEIGAEEFIPKPFHLRELLLRV